MKGRTQLSVLMEQREARGKSLVEDARGLRLLSPEPAPV